MRDQLGARAAFAVADVTHPRQLESGLRQLETELGDVDILVNNAGAGAYASVLEESPDTFEHMIAVNYLSTVHATRAVLAGMVKRRRGHIVNVASVAGRLGAPFEAAYSASKFAVVGFSEALAAEVAGCGVAVSLVDPGPVATRFTDARGVPFQRRFPRPLAADQVAKAVIRSVERGRFEQILPRWLASGVIVRALAPTFYCKGVVRSTAKEAAALAKRFPP